MGLAIRCVSNNASESPRQVAGWLQQHGFDLKESEVLTANELAGQYVAKRFRGKRVMALGSATLHTTVEQHGARLSDAAPVDAVVAGLGFTGSVDLDAIDRGIEAIRLGAAFLAIGPDEWNPIGETRFVPGVGSFSTAIAHATGRRPTLMGKPGPWAAGRVLESLGVSGREIVVVGDHLASDVVFGQRLGARTALVLTGCTLPWEVPAIRVSKQPPTVVLNDVAELPGWLESLLTG
jgi:HAD superfamily hydrolase (TIGR01450 family)